MWAIMFRGHLQMSPDKVPDEHIDVFGNFQCDIVTDAGSDEDINFLRETTAPPDKRIHHLEDGIMVEPDLLTHRR